MTKKNVAELLVDVLLEAGVERIYRVAGESASTSRHLRARHRRCSHSLMLVTDLNPHIGCGKAAKISRTAYREDFSVREAALRLGFLIGDQCDSWARPPEMTHSLGGEQ